MSEFYFNDRKHERVRLTDMQDAQGRRDLASDPQAKINSATESAIEQLMRDLSSDVEQSMHRRTLPDIDAMRLAAALKLIAVGDVPAARVWVKQLDPSVVECAVRTVGNLMSELLAYDSVARIKEY